MREGREEGGKREIGRKKGGREGEREGEREREGGGEGGRKGRREGERREGGGRGEGKEGGGRERGRKRALLQICLYNMWYIFCGIGHQFSIHMFFVEFCGTSQVIKHLFTNEVFLRYMVLVT